MILLPLASFLALAVAAAATAQPASSAGPFADRIEALRTANYRADATAAAQLRDEFIALAAEPRRSLAERSFAHHQAGFASLFLSSFVGPGSLANPRGDLPRMIEHLVSATVEFEKALALASEDADSHAALANTCGYLASLEKDLKARRELAARARTARERSLALAPRNPRVVAGHAGQLFWSPPIAGGDRPSGLDRYREALRLFAVEPPAERDRHAWGEPDVWTFLAAAHLASDPPDPAAAQIAVEAALTLRPDFAWAKGMLFPRIERALAPRVPVFSVP
jgi:hypothetical protein